MFFESDRGRAGPYILPARNSDEPIRLNEARLASWAIVIGHDRGSVGRPPRRPHRGMLPDVDFSRAVPVERQPGPITRLLRGLLGRRREGAAPDGAAPSGAGDKALGEAERKAYVWVLDWESDAAKPAAPARAQDRSRAA
jgi:hypothetical protein